MRVYRENRWPVLDRTVLERLADCFGCGIADLFVTRECPFFSAFKDDAIDANARNPAFLAVRRPDAELPRFGRTTSARDDAAISHVTEMLQTQFNRVYVAMVVAETNERLVEHLSENCVVLGSPMFNTASEVALCHMFDALPFDPAERVKFPFQFVSARGRPNGASAVVTAPESGERGIWLREQKVILQADYWPEAEFRERNVVQGRDCAVIAVMNHSRAGGNSRKLIVLSGFSGIGTETAATALSQSFRDLEPLPNEKYVWGVIEVLFRKRANDMHRRLIDYHWRYRSGGRIPIELTRRKSGERKPVGLDSSLR